MGSNRLFFENRGSEGSGEDKETPAACAAAIKTSRLAKTATLFEDGDLRFDFNIGGLVKVEF